MIQLLLIDVKINPDKIMIVNSFIRIPMVYTEQARNRIEKGPYLHTNLFQLILLTISPCIAKLIL